MLIFTDRGSWVYVDGPSEERHVLYRRLIIEIKSAPGGQFSCFEKPLYQPRRQRFPAGVLFLACRLLQDVEIKVIDEMTPPCKPRSLDARFNFLHDYQKRCVDLILERKRGIWQIATAGGKSLIAIALAHRLSCPTLFLVDEKQLLEQTCREWEKHTGTKAGRIGEGIFAPERFTVGSVQTLHSRRKRPEVRHYLASVGCLEIDEVHGAASRRTFGIAMRAESAYWRVGMSATPGGRTDQLDALTIGATGPILIRRTITDLAYKVGDGRRLAKPMVLFWKHRKLDPVVGTWDEVYRDGIATNEKRNLAIMELCLVAEKPALLFYHDVRHGHGKDLLRMLKNRGISAVLTSGKSTASERSTAVKMTDTGEVDVLVASSIFNKGVNIPHVRSAINAAGFKAFIPTIQKLGRGLRYVPGKDRFVLWEVLDRHNSILLRHCRERRNSYIEHGIEVKTFAALGDCVDWANRPSPSLLRCE